MGEARRRGTYEQRKAEAIELNAAREKARDAERIEQAVAAREQRMLADRTRPKRARTSKLALAAAIAMAASLGNAHE